MIYLATPYSHPNPEVREARYIRACQIAGALMRRGEHVFSPIAHCHAIARTCEMPTNWEFWREHDRKYISLSSELRVVKMDGWDISVGVGEEIEIARSYGVPVTYIEDVFEDTKE